MAAGAASGLGHGASMPRSVVAAISERIGGIVARSPFADDTSVVIRDLDSGTPIFRMGGDRIVPPASNAKLFTVVGALHALGPSHRFNTTVASAARQTGDVLAGDLYLVGGADPALDAAGLRELADQVAARGVRDIRGDVVVDESFLDSLRYVDSWPEHFRMQHVRPLGGLSIAQAADGAALSARAVPEPDLHSGSVFRELLGAAGVTVRGDVRRGIRPEAARNLGSHDSPPLADIAAYTLKNSSSTTAETLLRAVGRVQAGAGTTEAGARAVTNQLARQGLELPGLRIVDGSGLSSSYRASADIVAEVVSHSARDPRIGEAFTNALAVSGVDGTMQGRLSVKPVRGTVLAKSGMLLETDALAGIARRPDDGRKLAFSILVHRADDHIHHGHARQMIDAIAGAMVVAPGPQVPHYRPPGM